MRQAIEAAWDNRSLLSEKTTIAAIEQVIEDLDKGLLRVAEPLDNGTWQVNEWVKKAVVLYFPIRQMETIEVGPFEFHDKMALKRNYKALGVRVVPHAIARYGAYVAPGVIMMPSYTNIGAYVDSGTMIDTWATVGSCAQIGKDVHLSGGVGIGGVLEPLQAAPVIIEDGAFIGSRCIVVEGVRVGSFGSGEYVGTVDGNGDEARAGKVEVEHAVDAESDGGSAVVAGRAGSGERALRGVESESWGVRVSVR